MGPGRSFEEIYIGSLHENDFKPFLVDYMKENRVHLNDTAAKNYLMNIGTNFKIPKDFIDKSVKSSLIIDSESFESNVV